MVAREDPWWWVAVGVLIALLAMAVLMPVCLIKPILTVAERVAVAPSEAELRSTGKSLGLTLPILAIVAAVLLAGLSAWKVYDERETNSRWTWMLVAAGIVLVWATIMLQLALKVGPRLIGVG